MRYVTCLEKLPAWGSEKSPVEVGVERNYMLGVHRNYMFEAWGSEKSPVEAWGS